MSRFVRFVLAIICCPLIGAYGLRWLGLFAADLLGIVGRGGTILLGTLDILGSLLGLVLGVVFAIQLIGCTWQPESSPVRGTADGLLIVMALLFTADVVIVSLPAGAPYAGYLPPLNLVLWLGCFAATWRLSRQRRELRRSRQNHRPS